MRDSGLAWLMSALSKDLQLWSRQQASAGRYQVLISEREREREKNDMTTRLLHTYLSIIAALLFVILLWPPPANAEEQARGMGSYLLGPGMPIIFTFDRHSMSCAVSWGTLGAPGPGPYSAPPDMNKVNFGMVVFSLEISSFEVTNNRVTMTGLARSITTMNQWIIENAIYDFKVEAVDGGPPAWVGPLHYDDEPVDHRECNL